MQEKIPLEWKKRSKLYSAPLSLLLLFIFGKEETLTFVCMKDRGTQKDSISHLAPTELLGTQTSLNLRKPIIKVNVALWESQSKISGCTQSMLRMVSLWELTVNQVVPGKSVSWYFGSAVRRMERHRFEIQFPILRSLPIIQLLLPQYKIQTLQLK